MRYIRIWITTVVLFVGLLASLAGPVLCADLGQGQRDRLKDMAMETRRKAQGERGNLMRARMELMRLYGSYDLNKRSANAAIDKIGQSQLSLLNIHLDNQITVRRILNADQFACFREKLGKKMRGHEMNFVPGNENALDEFMDKTILEDLNLSANQQRQSKARINDLKRKRTSIIQSLQRDAKQMFDKYAQYNLDESACRKLIGSIHEQQTNLLNLNLRKQQAIRAVLSEAQFNVLADRISSWIKEQRPDGHWR